MIENRNPLSRFPMPRRRRDEPVRRPLDRPFETVDEDFDEVTLDDLHRRAGAGRIDVSDL